MRIAITSNHEKKLSTKGQILEVYPNKLNEKNSLSISTGSDKTAKKLCTPS